MSHTQPNIPDGAFLLELADLLKRAERLQVRASMLLSEMAHVNRPPRPALPEQKSGPARRSQPELHNISQSTREGPDAGAAAESG